MDAYRKSHSSRRNSLVAWHKTIRRASVRTRRLLFVLLCAGLQLFCQRALSTNRTRSFRSSTSHKVAIATNTIVTVFGNDLISEVLKELIDWGFAIDVFTCRLLTASSLNRSSRQVRIAFDPRFNKLSSKLQSYRALFSNAVHCSEELVH